MNPELLQDLKERFAVSLSRMEVNMSRMEITDGNVAEGFHQTQ